jgi:hypothetical protein
MKRNNMKKPRKSLLSAKINDLLKQTPLEARIKISCWFTLNDMIHDSGVREEAVWDETNPKDVEMMKLLDDKTKELTEVIMNNIKEWEEDGKPE